MSAQDVRAIVQQGYEAFGRGDIPGLMTLLDADVEWVSPGPPDLPTAGRRRGHSQVGEYFLALDSVIEIQRFEPNTFVAEGDRVVVIGSESAKMKATGNVLELDWVHTFVLRDRKVVAFREYVDLSALVAELRAAQARA